jgi:DNA-binding transcriptional MerR regulator
MLNISKQTLLRYEGKGVFPRAKRNMLNNWREYTEDDIDRLRQIMGRTR